MHIPDLGKLKNRKPVVVAAGTDVPQLDPNKMYYTEEMLAADGPEFILTLLLSAGVVTEEQVKQAKAQFMAEQNNLMLKVAETNPELRAILLELHKKDPSAN